MSQQFFKMVLTIGRVEVECESFRVRGAYSSTIARLFALPVAVASKEPLTLEITIKGNKFKPYKASRRVYWNKKHIGFFVLSNVSQEWDGDKYRTRLELKQCERSDVPDEPIPTYKWRHDLRALADNLLQTDGAKIEAGRTIKPFADSWKLGTNVVADAGALDAATARTNLGAIALADLPAYPTLASLGAVSNATFTNAINTLIPISAIGAASGVAPLGANSLVPSNFLPAYPTLASLGAVSNATYIAGLALKLDASARNTANGVAGLDASSLVVVNQIPPSVQFQLLTRTTSGTVDLNTLSFNHGLIRWFDNAAHPNMPLSATFGTLIQFDSLTGSTVSNQYKVQTFIAHNNRIADRHQNNSTWGAWMERAYLNGSQPFTSMQQFSASARFLGGTIPPVTATLTQAGVDASGNPRYWLVNATAPAGNRLKSITIAANGNIQFRHHADDGTDGNVLEHTASGNVLTNGTVRCGSGTTHFTGASFVPGALFYRSDIAMLIFSDGTNWRRMDTNAIVP